MPPPAEGLTSRLFLGPALRTQPDRRLVKLVREGYETAFEEIVRRYGRALSRYAASIVGGRYEDITQEAFSKALLALRRDDAEIELRPWLFRIVRNTALNDLRDSPPSPDVLAEAIAGGRNPAEELERREELADLMKRLQALPEPQRAAIVMRELEGLGHEEIAAALGLSGGAARQAIYRARQALRDAAGMLLPLPLLRLLIDHGAEAAGAGAGGVIAAASASAGGAGGAVKLGVVAAVLAGSVGTGVALQDHRGDQAARAGVPPAKSSGVPAPATPPSSPTLASVGPVGEGESDASGDDEGGHHRNQGEGGGSDRGGEDGVHGGDDDFDFDFDDDRHGGPGPPLRGPHNEGRRHGEGRGGHGGHDDGDRSGRSDDQGSGRHGEHSEPGGGGDGFTGDGRHGEHGGEGSSGPGDGGEHRPQSGPGPGGHSEQPDEESRPPPPPPEEEVSSGSGGSGESDGSGSGSDRSGAGGGGGG